jgi:hypothetical protein
MTAIPRFLRPRKWRNQDLVLYHGTLNIYSASIRSRVDVRKGRKGTDFGRGFYTTTVKRQARAWAWQLCLDYNGNLKPGLAYATPELIVFRVERDALAKLDCLMFARGDYHARDYWSLVHHCRSKKPGHGRNVTATNPNRWYDVVVGPVAAVWRTRLAIAGTDQYSFHTSRGANVLDFQRIEPVKTT